MDRPPILEARALSKTFTHPNAFQIFSQVSLSLFPGQSTAIMGPSGNGKSTLLHILGTLDFASSGELCIAGEPVTPQDKNRVRNRHIGFVFQAFHLLEEYTALSNVLMPALISQTPIHPGSPAYQRALDLLDRVGLSERAHFSVKFLSGGEKQRVAIARALCNDPDILLADEPSGNLDHQNSQNIHSLLLHFVRDLGKALCVVTHDQQLADLCDHRFVLSQGTLHSLS